MSLFTNIGLVEHAKMALSEGWGYVYGTIGQALTEEILKDKIRQYKEHITEYEDFIRDNWTGKRTVDCVNLIKSYIWWNRGNIKWSPDIEINGKLVFVDYDADGTYEAASEKGTIDTIPEIPGVCVRYNGHIGIYIGDGEVIESRGTRYGVVKTELGERGWTHWLKLPFIEYVSGHWAEELYRELVDTGINIYEKRFDDNITRGEVFALLSQIVNKLKER